MNVTKTPQLMHLRLGFRVSRFPHSMGSELELLFFLEIEAQKRP